MQPAAHALFNFRGKNFPVRDSRAKCFPHRRLPSNSSLLSAETHTYFKLSERLSALMPVLMHTHVEVFSSFTNFGIFYFSSK